MLFFWSRFSSTDETFYLSDKKYHGDAGVKRQKYKKRTWSGERDGECENAEALPSVRRHDGTLVGRHLPHVYGHRANSQR